MKIRMLTTRCGTDSENNWSENQVRNVSVEEAKSLIEQGVAIALEDFPTEKPVVEPEPAKVETPKSPFKGLENPDEGKGTGEGEKPASWGKGGKK